MWSRTVQHGHTNASQGGPIGALPQDLTSDGSNRKLGLPATPWVEINVSEIKGLAVGQLMVMGGW